MNFFNPKNWFKKPDPILVENQQFFSEFNQSHPLNDYSFVVFDTELTGLDRRKDEIVSIGAVRITNLQIDLGDTFYQIVQPSDLKHTDSTLIHRITPEEMRQARPLVEILPDFVRFVGNSLIVGHYVELDMFFLNKATWQFLGGTLSNPGIDTMRMAQGYKRMQLGYFEDPASRSESYRLEDLCREYNLPPFTAHDAFEDAMQTAYLFLWLLKKIRKGGLTTLRELYKAGHS